MLKNMAALIVSSLNLTLTHIHVKNTWRPSCCMATRCHSNPIPRPPSLVGGGRVDGMRVRGNISGNNSLNENRKKQDEKKEDEHCSFTVPRSEEGEERRDTNNIVDVRSPPSSFTARLTERGAGDRTVILLIIRRNTATKLLQAEHCWERTVEVRSWLITDTDNRVNSRGAWFHSRNTPR